MIKIGRISDISAENDENWLVVRSLKTAVPQHAIHEPRLSPSKSLFFQYLNAKNAGIFNKEWFQQIYVPTFLKELAADRENLLLMDQLYRDSFHKNILLACFCTDETLCHRSILAGMLAGAGAQIACKEEYKKYHRMFLDIMTSS